MTILLKQQTADAFTCVGGHEALRALLKHGGKVVAKDVDTGEHRELTVDEDGQIVFLRSIAAAIAETIAAKALAKAHGTRLGLRLARGAGSAQQ